MKKFESNTLQISLPELQVIETEGKRVYVTPDGNKYPSVTTVMGWQKRQFFAEWRKNNPEESKNALRRGNDFHSSIEKHLQNESWDKKLDKETQKMFDQVSPYLSRIDNILCQEVALWSDYLQLAGRVDCIAEFDGKLSIIDFKTSKTFKEAYQIEEYFMQAACYSVMIEERTGISIPDIVIIISCQDGEVQIFKENAKKYLKKVVEYIEIYNNEMNEPFVKKK